MPFNIFGAIDGKLGERHYKNRDLVRRMAPYCARHIRSIVLISMATLGLGVLSGVIAISTAQAITLFRNHADLQTILAWSVAISLFGVLAWLSNRLLRRNVSYLFSRLNFELRRDVVNSLLSHQLAFFDSQKVGVLVTQVISETAEIAALARVVSDLAAHAILIGILVIALVLIDPLLALIGLAVTPFFILASLVFRRMARDGGHAVQRRSAEIAALVHETADGIAIARTFRQELAMMARFRKLNQQAYEVSTRQGWIQHAVYPILDTLAGCWLALVVFVGGMRVIQAGVGLGSWFLFIRTVFLFHVPLTAIASFWGILQNGLAAAERILSLFDVRPGIVQIADEPIQKLKGDVVVDQVVMTYASGKRALHGISLRVYPGEKVAVVGATGSGKSSLIRVIARLYEFDAGRIIVDGYDLRDVNLKQYRAQLAVVSQTPILFAGSVAENIRFGRPHATDAEVRTAAIAIGDGEWLNHLPSKLATYVGERGSLVSAGQRQLIVLARTLLQDPAILLLDEATASVDPETETLLEDGLDRVMKERTCILAAHRLSTVMSADRIVVLEDGRIVEQGTHTELLSKNSAYARLYYAAFRLADPGSGRFDRDTSMIGLRGSGEAKST